MEKQIPLNKPFIAGKELYYIAQAVTLGNLAGDGYFTKKCSELFEKQFGIHKVLMTPSCTATPRRTASVASASVLNARSSVRMAFGRRP